MPVVGHLIVILIVDTSLCLLLSPILPYPTLYPALESFYKRRPRSRPTPPVLTPPPWPCNTNHMQTRSRLQRYEGTVCRVTHIMSRLLQRTGMVRAGPCLPLSVSEDPLDNTSLI